MNIRKAAEADKQDFIYLSVMLAQFNRERHNKKVKYDDFTNVKEAVTEKAITTFDDDSENRIILLAEIDNNVVGYALGRVYSEPDYADNGTGITGLFDELFVKPEARGQGLGNKLAESIIKEFQKRSIKRVKLFAYSWNNDAARLYEKLGFTEYVKGFEKNI